MTGSTSASELEAGRPPVRPRVRLAGLAAALAMALILALFGHAAPSRILFDAYQTLRPRDLSNTPVHVVWIDPPSIAAIGQWPWPRYYLARLTERIAAHGAKAIGFDTIFAERDRMSPAYFVSLYPELAPAAAAEVLRMPPLDADFAAVVGRSPVVLGRVGVSEPVEDAEGRPVDDGALPVEAAFSDPLPRTAPRFPHGLSNIAELDEVALGHGLLNGTPDPDGVVRRLLLAADVAGQPTPGLAMELARVASGAEAVRPQASGGRLTGFTLGSRVIPVDENGLMPIRFGNMPGSATSSAVDVLRSRYAGNVLKDKIVLVGLASEGTQDVVPTPLQSELFGILVQAQAIDAILRGGWLSRPRWAPPAEWIAGIALVALIVGVGPPRRRLAYVIVPAIALVMAAASFLLFDQANLLLDPVKPLALGGAAAAGLLAMALVDSQRDQQRLREALVVERVGAAEAAGELQAARAIQLGMLPARDSLAILDPRLDIDAQLEPARSVGGDFFDAVALQNGRVGFLIGDVTGKGVPASLFMALSKALAKSIILREAGDLAGAVAMLDAELSRDGSDEMGVTMIIGTIDTATGEALLCNAGHENPIKIDDKGRVSEVKLEGGPPFCVAAGFPYPAERVVLAPGEALVLVTDGVTEAQNAAGELFGHNRMLASLRAVARGGPEEITHELMSAVRSFEGGADPSDDLTVLALRYRG